MAEGVEFSMDREEDRRSLLSLGVLVKRMPWFEEQMPSLEDLNTCTRQSESCTTCKSCLTQDQRALRVMTRAPSPSEIHSLLV